MILVRLVAASILGAVACGAFAQATIKAAREDIVATYDFEPSVMTFSEQARRAPTLSKLWDRYDGEKDTYEPALRQLLEADGQRELLYCDGGMLLIAKSKAPGDRKLGLSSIGKCSFAEIEHTPYFYTMHSLAREGMDTLDLQWPMLRKPRYSVFIVPHALNLGLDYAFAYPLMVQEESRYVQRVADRARQETDPAALRALTLALYYAATPDAESRLRAMARPDSGYGAEARAAAGKAITRIDEARAFKQMDKVAQIAEMMKVSMSSGADELRAKRKARMRSISDEALMELDIYTLLLYRKKQ